MKRARPLIAAAAAILAAGCTASAPPATRPSAKPPAPGTPARLAARSPCPVTRPIPHAPPPAKNLNDALPVPYGWYGNAALMVAIPTREVIPAEADPQGHGEWGTKFPWWRAIHGKLTITAHRLDGPSAGFHGQIPAGYGTIGFIPSGLIWPEPGCWQVTGTVSGQSLTIVLRVQSVHS
jgi:hypothetical protein